MSKKPARLTKRLLDSLEPQKHEVFIWDADLKGFGVRVKPSGSKGFLIQYRNRNGRTRRLALGAYGKLTPEQARSFAKSRLADVMKGADPSAERHAARDAITVTELCREYLEKAEAGLIITRRSRKPKGASTIYVDRGRIERHIIPLLGKRTIKDVTARDVAKFRDDVTGGKTAADIKTGLRGRAIVRGGRGTASRTLGLLGGIFTYAVEQGYRDDNPARGVVRAKDGRRKVRLDADRYNAIGRALEAATEAGEPWQAVWAIRVIALTGCRRGEVEKLKRSEVDLAAQVLRLGDSKTGESMRPIGQAAVAALRQCLKRHNSDYVFPSVADHERRYAGLPKAWKRIRGGGPATVTPHGLRHGYAGVAEDLGLTVPTIGALLGHAGGSVTEGYIHKVDAVLVGAANRVAGRIHRAMIGADNVIELRA